jgi:hypothetical protein
MVAEGMTHLHNTTNHRKGEAPMITNTAPALSPVAKIEALYDRLTRARTLIADNKVHPVYGMPDHYIVEGKETKYLINGGCICPDARNRPELKGLCKHKLAAVIYSEQVPKATPPQADRSLEDKLDDLYPKGTPTNSQR